MSILVDVSIVKSIVQEALEKFYSNDIYLLEHDLHEQTISSKIACYLSIIIENKNLKYNVDVEYNRNGDAPKALIGSGNIRPDIIIHRRGKNNNTELDVNNLLIIEIKKWPNEEQRENDVEKIQEFIKDENFRYLNGVFISFKKEKDTFSHNIEWFSR